MMEIEQGIPVPRKKTGRPERRGIMTLLRSMAIGDSIFIENVGHSDTSGRITRVRQQQGGRFTSRSINGGIRVWRIE